MGEDIPALSLVCTTILKSDLKPGEGNDFAAFKAANMYIDKFLNAALVLLLHLLLIASWYLGFLIYLFLQRRILKTVLC